MYHSIFAFRLSKDEIGFRPGGLDTARSYFRREGGSKPSCIVFAVTTSIVNAPAHIYAQFDCAPALPAVDNRFPDIRECINGS